MRFPLPTAVLLCGLLLCGMAHAEPTACQRFEQQYAKQYDSILCVSEQTAIVGKRKLGTALADSQNRLLVPFSRDNWITPSSDHQDMQLLFIRRQNKKGVIDINGKPVLPPQYDDIYIPEEADAPIVIINHSPDGQLEGLADREGRILIEPRYYLIDRFSEGLAAYIPQPLTKYDEKNPDIRIGYLDTQGKSAIAPQFTAARRFNAGTAWVQHADNGDWLLIDRTGKTLLRLPYAYQNFDNFDANGLAIVKKDNLYGLINKRGESVLAAEYNGIYWKDTEQFYRLEKDGKYGAANTQGKAVIAPEFDNPTPWDSDKIQTPQGQIALIRGLTVYLFDQNGRQLAQRPARYAKQCAHVALGLPHKTKAGYFVVRISTDFNVIEFFNTDGDEFSGKCGDVAMPRKTDKTSKKRRS